MEKIFVTALYAGLVFCSAMAQAEELALDCELTTTAGSKPWQLHADIDASGISVTEAGDPLYYTNSDGISYSQHFEIGRNMIKWGSAIKFNGKITGIIETVVDRTTGNFARLKS